MLPWRKAGETAGRLRRSGETLPLTDIAIATAAASAGYAVWSFDGDFERIQTALDTLKIYRPD